MGPQEIANLTPFTLGMWSVVTGAHGWCGLALREPRWLRPSCGCAREKRTAQEVQSYRANLEREKALRDGDLERC